MIAGQERVARQGTTAAAGGIRSVSGLFKSRLVEDAQRTAAVHRTQGGWKSLTWSELDARGEELAWGLLSIGVQPAQGVSLIGSTRLEWTLCDLAAMFAGAVSVPVYHSNTADEMQFILENAGVVAAFIENAVQLKKLVEIRARLPRLHHVVLMEGEGTTDGWALSLSQLAARGREHRQAHPGELAARIAAQGKDDLSTILYTSGTTGVPKGVLITNDNMIFAAENAAGTGLLTRDMSQLLFLPFAHSFAQIIKASWFGSGMQMIFAESVEKLVPNAMETPPTLLCAVPRVYEKIYNGVVTKGMNGPGLKGSLFRMAMREFDAWVRAQDKKERYSSLRFSLAKKLVFPKVREQLAGLVGGKLQRFISGGAPLAPKIGWFFDLLGFDMLEGYGLTETIAMTSVNLPGQTKIGTVGRAFPGIEVKIAADGEILERGRNVMRGYHGLPEQTAEAIDSDGWYHTGDIGEIDSDGFIKITDRKKDLIKTSGGKYIAPQAIENALKTASEVVSQVVVIGDRRKYVSVLLTVADEPARKAAAAAGQPASTYAEAAASGAVRAKVQAAIDGLNATLPQYETIKRFTILPRDFAQETGELTPTLKVKRKACTQKYKAQIDAMYDGESVD
ncbi:MAG: AMP-dependent synthetase/ligase [Myxococcales bacterium]